MTRGRGLSPAVLQVVGSSHQGEHGAVECELLLVLTRLLSPSAYFRSCSARVLGQSVRHVPAGPIRAPVRSSRQGDQIRFLTHNRVSRKTTHKTIFCRIHFFLACPLLPMARETRGHFKHIWHTQSQETYYRKHVQQ